MTNDVVEKKGVFGGKVGMANVDALKSALTESAAKDPRGSAPDGASYMNFSGKLGSYEVGTDKHGVDPEELFLLNVPAFEDGWICWKDSRPAAKRMYPLGTEVPTPNFEEHGPFPKDGDGWYQAKSLMAKNIDTGEQVYFSINSVSGVSVFAGLQTEITNRIRSGQPYWPVVKFSKEGFTARGFKNFKPVITIDGWLNDTQVMETLPALFEDEEADIDMEQLYIEALGVESLPTGKEKAAEPEKATRRRRRSSL